MGFFGLFVRSVCLLGRFWCFFLLCIFHDRLKSTPVRVYFLRFFSVFDYVFVVVVCVLS